MNNIFLFVKVNGQWNENNVYKEKETRGILVPIKVTRVGLLQNLYEELQLSPENHTLDLKYETGGGFAPVKICNDRSLMAYMELKKNEPDKTKFTLCLEISDQPMRQCGVTRSPTAVIGLPAQLISPCRSLLNNFSESVNEVDDVIEEAPVYENGSSHGNDVICNQGLEDICPLIIPSIAEEPQNAEGQKNENPDEGQNTVQGNQDEKMEHFVSSEAASRPSSGNKSYSSNDSCEVLDIYSPTLIKVNGMYANKKALQRHLQMFAIHNHFQFRVKTSKIGTLHVVCLDENCKWSVRGTKIRSTQLFIIKRFDSIHTCSTDIRIGDHPHATSHLIGDCIKHRFVDAARSLCRPSDIMQIMQQDYGVHMTYKKAWRSKEKALESLYGTDEESYASLPILSYMLTTCNPGSVIDVVTDKDERFVSFFMSLKAFIDGWQYCRPVIIVDATFLKSFYRGTLFTACGMDANEQVFPIAFGVGDSENIESWDYFFGKMKQALGERENLAIISDRHPGILNAVKKAYPNADHGFCMHHLLNNVKKKFKRVTKAVHWKFFNAARAYTVNDWEKFMTLLDLEDKGIRKYLSDEVGNDKWARCFFNGKRYSIMTSNNAESMNAMDVKAREFPIAKLIDFLRERMQEWFYNRREKAASCFTILSKEAESRLNLCHGEATGMTVKPSSAYEFEVIDRDCRRWVVNLEERTCSCREFQLDTFVCAHAIAACRLRGYSVYNFISQYYKKEAWEAIYNGVVHPTGNSASWNIPNDIKSRVVKPPMIAKRSAGRPKKKRHPSQGEDSLPRQKCTRCKQIGHNRKTCRSAIALSNSQSQ